MQRSIGLEIAASVGIYAVSTSATGTDWVQLKAAGTLRCNQVEIVNDTGTTLALRYCTSAGAALTGQSSVTVATGARLQLRGIYEAAQVQVQRADTSSTQVSVKFITEGVAAV